jgi:uncharacterized protein YjbI with pentapeptide repeats
MDMKERIIDLFKKYGFEYRKQASNNDYLAFTFKSGFFHNAELVSLLIEDKERVEKAMENAAQDLEDLGFSTKKSFYKSISDIDETLFRGFFNVDDWKKKIKSEYNNHCKRILSILPKEADTYTYIDVPYLKNNESNSENIIRDICSSLNKKGPQLSIIEAPAGFGKTCTSYEIINYLVEDQGEHPVPFFTEFSRDRQARVFSHIFVREVDKSFDAVNSDVVINEVKKGRIAIILDGFDELLHDSSSSDENDENDGFENAEPMLETISELLTNNAKIVLTSRRSAIFDGELFNEWIERYKNQFTVNRYRISEPAINDWIPPSRLEKLNTTTVNVNNLANPVLLSFLRFVNDEYFSELCKKPSLIVDQYFLSMLEREMDRQDLRMNASQQAELLTLVATDMCEHNYTSDSKEKIINTIKEKAGYILNEVRALYSPVDKPTIDKLATTLSNHAFFDRSNQEDNHIQFVNEFVFGNYISNSILGYDGEWMASDERFIEPAVLSYISRDEENRLNLWDKLTPMTEFIDSSTRMKFEGLLTGMIKDVAYNGSEITSISLSQQEIFSRGNIKNCVIKNCTFTGCFFYFDNFVDVTFLNCTFWDCTFENSNENELAFYNCNDNNNSIHEFEKTNEIDIEKSEPNIENYILSKIWPAGQSSIKSLYYFTSNFFKTESFSRKEIIKSIKSLKRSGYLEDAHDANFIAINKNKISEIKSILGRNS